MQNDEQKPTMANDSVTTNHLSEALLRKALTTNHLQSRLASQERAPTPSDSTASPVRTPAVQSKSK